MSSSTSNPFRSVTGCCGRVGSFVLDRPLLTDPPLPPLDRLESLFLIRSFSSMLRRPKGWVNEWVGGWVGATGRDVKRALFKEEERAGGRGRCIEARWSACNPFQFVPIHPNPSQSIPIHPWLSFRLIHPLLCGCPSTHRPVDPWVFPDALIHSPIHPSTRSSTHPSIHTSPDRLRHEPPLGMLSSSLSSSLRRPPPLEPGLTSGPW